MPCNARTPINVYSALGSSSDGRRAGCPEAWQTQNLLGFALMDMKDELGVMWLYSSIEALNGESYVGVTFHAHCATLPVPTRVRR